MVLHMWHLFLYIGQYHTLSRRGTVQSQRTQDLNDHQNQRDGDAAAAALTLSSLRENVRFLSQLLLQ